MATFLWPARHLVEARVKACANRTMGASVTAQHGTLYSKSYIHHSRTTTNNRNGAKEQGAGLDQKWGTTGGGYRQRTNSPAAQQSVPFNTEVRQAALSYLHVPKTLSHHLDPMDEGGGGGRRGRSWKVGSWGGGGGGGGVLFYFPKLTNFSFSTYAAVPPKRDPVNE